MDTACHRGKNRKYAANSKHAEHTGIPQRLYLRFLCAKRAACSLVPEFAAYFGKRVEGKLLKQTDTQAPHSCLAPNVIQPLGPICNKEKAGTAGTKHILIKTINLFV